MVHVTKEEKRNSILKSVIQCSQLGCTHSYSKSNSPRAASALKHNAIDFLDGEREGEGYECQKLDPTNMTYMQCAVAMAKVRTRAGKFGESEAFLPFSEKVTHNYHSFPEPSSMNSNSGNPVVLGASSSKNAHTVRWSRDATPPPKACTAGSIMQKWPQLQHGEAGGRASDHLSIIIFISEPERTLKFGSAMKFA